MFFPQTEYFRDAVLHIEGDNVSAIDVSHHLDRLRSHIFLRQKEKYLHPDTEDEIAKLVESEDYDGEMIQGAFDQFFGNSDFLYLFSFVF